MKLLILFFVVFYLSQNLIFADFLDVTEKSVKISKHHKNFTSIRNESTTEKPKEIVTTTETELNKEVSTTKHSSSSSKTIDVKDKTVVNPLDIDEKEKATSGKSHATTEKSAVDKKQKDGVPLDVVTTTPSPKKEKNKGSEKKNDDDTSKNQTIQWFLGGGLAGILLSSVIFSAYRFYKSRTDSSYQNL